MSHAETQGRLRGFAAALSRKKQSIWTAFVFTPLLAFTYCDEMPFLGVLAGPVKAESWGGVAWSFLRPVRPRVMEGSTRMKALFQSFAAKAGDIVKGAVLVACAVGGLVVIHVVVNVQAVSAALSTGFAILMAFPSMAVFPAWALVTLYWVSYVVGFGVLAYFLAVALYHLFEFLFPRERQAFSN